MSMKFIQKLYTLAVAAIDSTTGRVKVSTPISVTASEEVMTSQSIASLTGKATIGKDVSEKENFSVQVTTDKDVAVFIQDSDDNSTFFTLSDKNWSDTISHVYNDSIGITPTQKIPLPSKSEEIFVHNTHISNNLLVSFDNELHWTTIPPEQSLLFPVNVSYFHVKGSAAGTTYETLSAVTADYVNLTINPDSENSVVNAHLPFASNRKYIRVVVYNLDDTDAAIVSASIVYKESSTAASTPAADISLDPVVNTLVHNNVTINSDSSSSTIDIKKSIHVDLLIKMGVKTGSPLITFYIDVIEKTSGATIRSYASPVLSTTNAVGYISIDELALGDTLKVRWAGTLDGSNWFANNYVRLIAKSK